MNKKQKSLTNKGFSLVELIIVIAIMAVLVGALAPQYVKYLDKSKVSADIQLANAVKQAIEVTIIDTTVAETAKPKNTDVKALGAEGTGDFWNEVYEILKVANNGELIGKLKLDQTTGTGDAAKDVVIQYSVSSAGNVTVQISGGKYGTPGATGNENSVLVN